MDQDHLETLINETAFPGARRHLLTGLGSGIVLAASGLILPADLDAKRGRGRQPGEKRQRRKSRRHKRQKRRDKAGRFLLKNIDLDVTGDVSFWVRPAISTAKQYSPKVETRGSRTSYETIKVHLNDDAGYVLIPLGSDALGLPKGVVIFMNNPTIGRPTWTQWDDATFTTFGVSGTKIFGPDTIYNGGGWYIWNAGDLEIHFTRNDDTDTINFAVQAYKQT